AKPDTDHVGAGGIQAKWKQHQLVLNVLDAAPHQTLYGVNGAFWLSEQAATRRFSDDEVAVRIEAHDGRAKRRSIWPGNAQRLFRLRVKIRDQAVGCAQIDSDDASHFF